MKWQVTDVSTKEVRYVDPATHFLVMNDCKLRNHPKTAERIFNGENKTVCAWIQARTVAVVTDDIPQLHKLKTLSYNPRVKPYWADHNKENCDNMRVTRIVSHGRLLFSSTPYFPES